MSRDIPDAPIPDGNVELQILNATLKAYLDRDTRA
jgi:hypothetical protein